MNKIVYVETGTEDVYENFGTEYYIATESDFYEKTGCDTAFLFWRTSPTLMVGKYQNILSEIDTKYADEHDINIVRRMSGGGTIYTDMGSWQFTFISKRDANVISFSEYLEPIITALSDIGVNAKFSGRNDLLTDGKKISGNAQYKLGGMTIHHGSLLFNTDIEQMVRSTTVDQAKLTSKGIKSVRERVTNISEHLNSPITPDRFKKLIIEHIVGCNPVVYEFEPSEIVRISEIADERFHSWESIYGAEPRFSIVKSAQLAGGRIEFSFEVKKGRICNCLVFGDFFSMVDSVDFYNALYNCKYEYNSIVDALMNADLGEAFYNISASDIARVMTS